MDTNRELINYVDELYTRCGYITDRKLKIDGFLDFKVSIDLYVPKLDLIIDCRLQNVNGTTYEKLLYNAAQLGNTLYRNKMIVLHGDFWLSHRSWVLGFNDYTSKVNMVKVVLLEDLEKELLSE